MEIIDLFGYFLDESGKYNKDNQWFGKVLVEEDNTFEGVGENYTGDVKYFIFGNKDKEFLNITRCVIGGDPTCALEFKAEISPLKDKYQGFCAIDRLGVKHKLANCKIATQSADKTRNVTINEYATLRFKINACKINLAGYHADLYDQFKNVDSSNYSVYR